MVKSVISILVATVILISGAAFEQKFVSAQFEDFKTAVDLIKIKAESNEATVDDLINLRENWLDKKKSLHVFIPHNEIKELELWLSEAVSFAEFDDQKELVDKLEVLSSLSNEIPKTFLISFENIL